MSDSTTAYFRQFEQVVYPFTIPVGPTSLNLVPIETDVIITKYAPGIVLFGFKRFVIPFADQRPGGGIMEFQFPTVVTPTGIETPPFYEDWYNSSFQSASIYASTRIITGGEFQIAHTGSGFFGLYNLGLSGYNIPNCPPLAEWIFTSLFMIS
jgi:hypothetical protein